MLQQETHFHRWGHPATSEPSDCLPPLVSKDLLLRLWALAGNTLPTQRELRLFIPLTTRHSLKVTNRIKHSPPKQQRNHKNTPTNRRCCLQLAKVFWHTAANENWGWEYAPCEKMGYISGEQPGPLFLTTRTNEQEIYSWKKCFPSVLITVEVLMEGTSAYPSNTSQINSDDTHLLSSSCLFILWRQLKSWRWLQNTL